jgi:hypothetical protein
MCGCSAGTSRCCFCCHSQHIDDKSAN